ncbi:MAG: peptidase M23 [Flavobacteriaceae bacterium]|nr:peptidase M23 [Flavobacteriaceae bacterium]|tara:strand:+ start:659 stop:1876 length:1218 start_codon:yes stop_codon:yes gene_type:complete
MIIRSYILKYFLFIILIQSCVFDFNTTEEKQPKIEFGFEIDNYKVSRDTIRSGDSFGEILINKKLSYPQIYKIVQTIKDSFDIRWLTAGKPYTILSTKDSLEQPLYFIYQPNKLNYVVIDFANFDSIVAYNKKKPFKIVRKTTSGSINSSLSETMDQQGLPWELINQLSDIYAWTIDFSRLQQGDRFKIIYNERYIEDTLLVGIKSIDAAYFEHNREEIYAFHFITDSLKVNPEFYDDNGNSLQRTFLKSPLRFSNISSRYNLKRRIAYYGNKVRPHKGTDFAAPVGTPIMATADGRVVKSSYTRGNGYYVKIQHNNKYSTQYLHMQKNGRIKKGAYVKQGDVIGRVGMTGNTSGPHVCYRFWKNNRQVDPFKQKLPPGQPVSKNLKANFDNYILPLKTELNQIK